MIAKENYFHPQTTTKKNMRSLLPLLPFLTVTLFIPHIIHAKTTLGTAQLTGELTEAFLGKFAFTVGDVPSSVSATFWTETPYLENSRSLNMYLYCDEEWEQAKQMYTCVEKAKLARKTVMLDMNDQFAGGGARKWALRDEIKFQKNVQTIDGASFVKTTLSHYVRTHYWYAFVADCSLEMYQHQVPLIYYNVRVCCVSKKKSCFCCLYHENIFIYICQYLTYITLVSWDYSFSTFFQITFLNQDISHLPADEEGLWEIHFFNFIIMLIGLCVVLFRMWKTMAETKSIHFAVLLLLLSIGLTATSSFCELIHLSTYIRNGQGFQFFDVFSAMNEALSDVVVSFVLLAIGSGWTLKSGSSSSFHHPFDPSRPSSSQTSMEMLRERCANPIKMVFSPTKETFLFMLLFLFHLGLVLWSALGFHDDFEKFHDHEHLPGKILMWLRISTCLLFVLLCTKSMKHFHGELIYFLKLFRTCGFLWFACMPIFIFISEFFAQYLRHPIITGGTLIIQSTTLCCLAWLFVGSRNTVYQKRSTVDASGMLFCVFLFLRFIFFLKFFFFVIFNF